MMRDNAVFLFDLSAVMAKPWLEAGYDCWVLDTQHPPAYDSGGVTAEVTASGARLYRVNHDLTKPWLCPIPCERIVFVGAFPPCDHLAVSGARWFRGKGLRFLAKSIELFATAAEFCEWAGAPYFIENPVSNISSHWRKPDHYFSPHFFTGWNLGDNYTKKTCLWTGHGFVMPTQQQAEGLGKPDDRIHKAAPGPDRHNFRSQTPLGFSLAVFAANSPRGGLALPDEPRKLA
jgi:hypothetical protein